MSLFQNVMMSAGFAGLVLVSVPGSAVAAVPAAPEAVAATADDSTLESQIQAAFKKNSTLAPRHIDVNVDHGVAKLTGKVRTVDEKTRAGELAKVTGIARVDNQIEIDPKIDESKIDAAAQKTKEGTAKATDATANATKKAGNSVEKGVGKAEQGVGKAAEKTAEAFGKTGDKVTDTSITTRVKADFSNEQQLKGSAIDVDTNNHVVTLKGTVDSSVAKTRAETIARGVQGVTRVVNELVVRGQ
jgi:osmotically-inducible protein OsmY